MMSSNDAPVIITGDSQIVKSYASQETAQDAGNNVSTSCQENNQEILRCFVCDAKVEGRRYSLATCKTQSSRARIIEKLGELVGERYVVVISEDDVICRSCASLMNTLDRLESETKGVKAAVLRFLECKYSLAEGELLDSCNTAKPCQPPQITRSDSHVSDYHSRKRGPVSVEDKVNGTAKKGKKSVWMRCDKCRYTTLYDTFMDHHIKRHIKQNVSCNKCGAEFPGAKSAKHLCKEPSSGNVSGETEKEEKKAEAQVMQCAAVETVDDLSATGNEIANVPVALPILTIQPNAESSISVKDEPIQLINLANPNSLQFQNILANDGSLRGGQPMFMRVLQQYGVGEDFGQSALIATTNSDTSMVVKAHDNSAKQMLTLAADGSLEMVAVDCWDDINPQDPEPDMTF